MNPTSFNTISPGRVELSGGTGDVARVQGFEYATQAPKNAPTSGIRGNFEANTLNQTYFSSANFQIVQNAIRKTVYDKTGEVIDPVSSDDLFMVMRAIYLQYGRNLPTHIREQIQELNDRVVTWCVPKIVAEVSMYKTYKKDISTLPTPMEHPVLLNSAGTRSLPFKPFF
jgi:hypothetical protein